MSSTARLELTQQIDSFDTVALKDSEQVNDGLDMLESNLKTNISRTSRVSCIVSSRYVVITLADDIGLHSNATASVTKIRAHVASLSLSSALLTVLMSLDGS